MKKRTRFPLIISVFLLVVFFILKTLELVGFIKPSFHIDVIEYLCFVFFVPLFCVLYRNLPEKGKETKYSYLEHAAKIIRHDMHSGINTYIPRGISSLERRLTEEQIKDLKLEAPLKMIKEGLKHTQKVYKGVYEFTNLVKKDSVLEKNFLDLSVVLEDYLSSTAYRPQVVIEDLGFGLVNEALFCTAIDNLIRNGLKYNDSLSKTVRIKRQGDFLFVEDNGRGMTSEEFNHLSKPYVRKQGQKETGSGLGLNICLSILEEHGFTVQCEKLKEGGSRIKINMITDEA
jgi:signal transduction histidine kinase